MVWQEPNKFLVSGVDERTRIQRILLRFKTAEAANQVADLLREDLSVVVEPLSEPPEEIQIELQVIYSLRIIIPATIRIIIGLLLLLGLVISISQGTLGEVGTSLVVIFLGYIVAPALLALVLMVLMRRPIKSWLRFERSAVIIKSNWSTFLPRAITWENATDILVKSRGSKIRIQFLSSADAARAVQMLRERFPKLEQTNIAY